MVHPHILHKVQAWFWEFESKSFGVAEWLNNVPKTVNFSHCHWLVFACFATKKFCELRWPGEHRGRSAPSSAFSSGQPQAAGLWSPTWTKKVKIRVSPVYLFLVTFFIFFHRFVPIWINARRCRMARAMASMMPWATWAFQMSRRSARATLGSGGMAGLVFWKWWKWSHMSMTKSMLNRTNEHLEKTCPHCRKAGWVVNKLLHPQRAFLSGSRWQSPCCRLAVLHSPFGPSVKVVSRCWT